MQRKNKLWGEPVREKSVGFEKAASLHGPLLALLSAFVFLLLQGAALGQTGPERIFSDDQFEEEIPRGETVRSRERPEVDPVGIRAGGFLFYPALRQGVEFNDNIYATENNTKSDFLYSLQPSVSLRSDWNNHRLYFDLGGDIGFYFDETSENYQDVRGRVGGTIEITSRNAIRLQVGGERGHETRDSPDNTGSVEPTIFKSVDGGLQYVHRFNRMSLAGGGTIRRLDFDDGEAAGGAMINNDDRDRTVFRPGLRVAYEFMPHYSAFVRGEGQITDYDAATDDNGFKRDSRGFDVVAGASIDITGLLFGDVFGGYRERYFDDNRFDSVKGAVFGAGLTWVPTRLTTVMLKVKNEVVETITDQASSFTSSGVSLDVDHELLRNLILGAGLGYRFDDYDGVAREESNFGARFSVDYLMNRYMRLQARYRYQMRDSNVAGGDYTQNSAMLFLTLTP